jgi:hypothetical protein
MTLLTRTCKEVAAILIAREDRALGFGDRFALYIHLKICDSCPRFERQVLTMRNGMRKWRNYTTQD